MTNQIIISDNEREIVRKAECVLSRICEEAACRAFPTQREIAIKAIAAINDLGLSIDAGAHWDHYPPTDTAAAPDPRASPITAKVMFENNKQWCSGCGHTRFWRRHQTTGYNPDVDKGDEIVCGGCGCRVDEKVFMDSD